MDVLSKGKTNLIANAEFTNLFQCVIKRKHIRLYGIKFPQGNVSIRCDSSIVFHVNITEQHPGNSIVDCQ